MNAMPAPEESWLAPSELVEPAELAAAIEALTDEALVALEAEVDDVEEQPQSATRRLQVVSDDEIAAVLAMDLMTPGEKARAIAGAAAWRVGAVASLRRAGMIRTLADISDEPPGPLLFGMLEDGPTLAYGPPGVGKGTTGAYLCVEALQAGLTPVIYDSERRPREWARRVSGLGGDRGRVVYIEPADLGPTLAGRPLWDVAPAIAERYRDAGGDFLIIDSILPAVGLSEERMRSDPSVPFMYVSALEDLGIRSLSFGHPPKGQPDGDPFGSFGWLAAMRLTWVGSLAEGDGHRIRWRPRKRNERGHIPGILLTINYAEDGRPCAIDRADDEESTRDRILAMVALGPRSAGDMAEELVDELESPSPGELERVKERLGKALRRMAREGWIERLGKPGRGATWALRVRS